MFKMEEPTTMMNRKSWESLSSSFSNLDVSFSQDSCYASDEISVVSSNPTTVDTSVAPSKEVSPELSLGPSLKSILKKPEAIPEENMESGYRTDASEYEYEAMSNENEEEQNNDNEDEGEGEEDEEDLCDVSLWGDASDISEIGDDGEIDFADDGSFIAFESMVRFAPNVEYIEAPDTEDDEEETSTGLTCHEIMELARSSGSVQFLNDDEATAMAPGDDHERDEKPGVCGCVPMMDDPEEHTGDMVDLDRQLFVAYVNGIKEVADSQYKARLRALVDDIRLGQAETPYLENNDTDGVFFDHALNHVLGVFRNLMVPEEWAELVALSAQKDGLAPQSRAMANHNSGLMERVQHLLVERLAQGNVDVEPDELRFFAGGIIYALENWQGLLLP